MAKRPTAKLPASAVKPNAQVRQVADSLANLMTGMGTEKDKMTFTRFAYVAMDRQQLESAYRMDWVSRKICDIPANDATREWRAWQAENKQITVIEEAEKKFRLQRKVRDVLTKARLYGGAALIMGVNQGNQEDPLELDRIKKGDLKFVHVVANHELHVQEIEYDLESPWYNEPKFYTRQAPGQAPINFHPSRVVRFIGAEIPDISQQASTWGDPVLQIVQDAILSMGMVSNAIAQMVQESKVDVIRIPELTENIMNKDYEARLKSRFGLASLAKSIYSMLLLDKEEEWQRIETTFTALPDVLKTYMLLAAGAAHIPSTILLGQSPAGLNATGESDVRNYYDRISTEQKTEISPTLERLDEVMLRSLFGTLPDSIFYEWNSLWQMDEAQKSDIAVKKANVFKADVDAGLFPDEVLREARANQLIEDGTYPGLEGIIDEFGLEPEEPEIDPALVPQPIPGNQNLTPEQQAAQQQQQQAAAVADAINRRARGMRPRRFKNKYGNTQLADARPRSLYVYRRVMNAGAIIAWAKEQGFDTTVPANELHCTIAYSKQPVDWLKVARYEAWGQDEAGRLRVAPGGARVVEPLGNEGAVVLMFTSSALSSRWRDLKECGAEWDYEDYQPHVTITYKGAPANLDAVEPYRGEIVFGPEIFEEINVDRELTIERR